MKVAFIGTRGVPGRYGGFETAVDQIGRRLVDRGHEVVVYCRRSLYPDRPSVHLGMQLRYPPAIRSKHLETLTHTAVAAAHALRGAHAIVCMGVGNAPVVAALEALGRSVVWNVDGADWQREKWGRFARWYLRQCEGMAAVATSAIVADSRAVQEYYWSKFGRASHFIPYGAVQPSRTSGDTLAAWGLEAGKYALFVGRLVPENAPHDVIAGWRMAGVPMPLVIVGGASYSDRYIAELRACAGPDTIFTGYQFGSAYDELTTNAAMFILGAQVGGTHPVLVEQMAAGNLVFARDTASNREVLADAGVLWTSVDDLASAIRAVWFALERVEDFRSRASARASKLYNWDRITDSYLALCESVSD